MKFWLFAALTALVLGLSAPVLAQNGPMRAPTSKIEVNQLPPAGVASFDVEKAVNAYMSRQSAQEKAKSDAYYEGGYVLQVVDLLYILVVTGVLLWFKISSRMREIAEDVTRSRFWQVPIYVGLYTVLTTIIALPLTIYEQFWREHHYGLSNQSFGSWAGDFAIQFVAGLIGAVFLWTIVYAVIRAARRSWWVWGSAVAVLFLILAVAIQPVFIAPLTNHYSKLPESGMRNAILSMARANGIPAGNVYTFDASKQTTKISANVSGALGTTRISLNDNLLNRGTPSEVLAVMGHEMGHYVMNHVAIQITWFGLLIVLAFLFVDKAFAGLAGIFGGNWDVRTIDDPAGLPLVTALISVFFFFGTPVTNTIIRTQEIQADIFGLNAVRQPDAFATAALKLGDYRKLDPSPWEEFVFFDHPSGRHRIEAAMRWKAEHLNDPDIMAGPISPQ